MDYCHCNHGETFDEFNFNFRLILLIFYLDIHKYINYINYIIIMIIYLFIFVNFFNFFWNFLTLFFFCLWFGTNPKTEHCQRYHFVSCRLSGLNFFFFNFFNFSFFSSSFTTFFLFLPSTYLYSHILILHTVRNLRDVVSRTLTITSV